MMSPEKQGLATVGANPVLAPSGSTSSEGQTHGSPLRFPGTVLLAIGLFVGLTLVMTYPLPLRLTTALLGAPGDNFEFMFKVRFFADRLRDGQLWPLTTPNLFYPFSYDLRFAESTYISLSLALPVTLAAGEVAGFNWVTLLSFVLSGFTAYLLARLLTRQQGPAVIGGILFAFSTYRMYRAGIGHLLYLAAFAIPLQFLYIELTIRRRRLRWAVLAALCYALTTLASWVYGYVTALGMLIYALARLWPWRSTLRDRRLWMAAGAFALVAGLILGLPAALLAQIRHGAGLSFSLADADLFSGDLLALLAPNPAHPIMGPAILRENFIPPIGWLSLILVVLSLRRRPERFSIALWVVLVATVVLTWGLTLHWDGVRVYLPVPGIVERVFARVMSILTEQIAPTHQQFWVLQRPGSIFIPLPAYFLFLFLPLSDSLREWGTYAVLVSMAVAMLAAWALAALAGRWRPLILAAIALLAVAELLPAPFAYGYSQTFTQPLVTWLQQRADGGVVARFPIKKWTNGTDQYDAYTSGHPSIDGYAAFQPRQWRDAFPILDRFPAPETMQLLRRYQVRYVVVSPASYGAAWTSVEAEIAASPGLRQVAAVPYLSRFRSARLTPPGPVSDVAYVPVSEWLPRPAGAALDTLRIYELAP